MKDISNWEGGNERRFQPFKVTGRVVMKDISSHLRSLGG